MIGLRSEPEMVEGKQGYKIGVRVQRWPFLLINIPALGVSERVLDKCPALYNEDKCYLKMRKRSAIWKRLKRPTSPCTIMAVALYKNRPKAVYPSIQARDSNYYIKYIRGKIYFFKQKSSLEGDKDKDEGKKRKDSLRDLRDKEGQCKRESDRGER